MSIIRIIPSLLTLSNLICGVMAIIIADVYYSSILIVIAALFDLFDGAVARALNATSEMGKELDSLCDMVSFGVAPAFLYYLLSPTESWVSFIPVLVISCCAALRLAKFNTLPPDKDFIGLASPAAALMIIGISLAVVFGQPLFTTWISQPATYILLGSLTGVAMVINLRMFSMKGLSDPEDRKWILILILGAVIVSLIDWRLTIPVSLTIYLLLSLIRSILSR